MKLKLKQMTLDQGMFIFEVEATDILEKGDVKTFQFFSSFTEPLDLELIDGESDTIENVANSLGVECDEWLAQIDQCIEDAMCQVQISQCFDFS